jgi:hypothetical protein
LSKPSAVQILGQKTRNLWPSEQHDDVTVFGLPDKPIDAVCTVVAVDLTEPLAIAVAPVISAGDDKFYGSMQVDVAQPAGSKVAYHYTTDGSEPTAKSAAAGKAFTLTASATVKARGFIGDKPVTRTVARAFEAMKPLTAVQTFKADPGLAFRAYEVPESIKTCAEIDATKTAGKMVKEGVAPVPSESVKPREEFFGLVFNGFIEVPETGLYRFFVDSDDGSVLKLHGNTVVDNDGLHSATEKSAAIALEKGLHPIEIRMLEAAGQDLLRVSWQGPGMGKKTLVPAKAYIH